MRFTLLLAFLATSAQAQLPPGKIFDQAFQEFQKAPEYQATESEIRAIELDFESRDLVLEPVLELGAERVNENRQLLNSTAVTTKPRTDTLRAFLSKPFSTGTTLVVGPVWERALTPNLTPGNRDTMDWQVALTQSLWQDGFGRSTSLRRARENFEKKQQLAAALLRRGQLLVEFESLYWDWALALREQELQEKNLKRSREISRWVQDRFKRSAAESSDLLQARALTTVRELRVAGVRQNLTLVRSRIERYVPGRTWQPEPKDLLMSRSLEGLPVEWKADTMAHAVPLESISVVNDALAAKQRAGEVRESTRPELNLELAYGKNAIDTRAEPALRRSYTEDHEYSSVGVVFRTSLDVGGERRLADSARATSLAAEQRSHARQAEAKIAWEQLKLEIADLQARIESAKQLVDLQSRKSDAERQRYRMGRATAFQAITFEQEAAEAELTLWSLYALMRKTEARAHLFAQ